MVAKIDTKKWVVESLLKGDIIVPREENNLPVKKGRASLTPFAILEQNLQKREFSKILKFGIVIPENLDHIYVAWKETEVFVRALAVEKDVPIKVQILRMTDKSEEWPRDLEFIDAYPWKMPRDWQPADHHNDPKNRVTFFGRMTTVASTRNMGGLGESHFSFRTQSDYISELVKDYLSGLDAGFQNLSLAMLYFFKVLERIGKEEYGNPPNSAMSGKTKKSILSEVEPALSKEEMELADSVCRWRHTKSEAHLVTEGFPTIEELRLCKKMARYLLEKRI